MPQRNVASNFTFEQQRVEINELAADFWTQKGVTDAAAASYLLKDGSNAFTGASLAVPNAFTINSNSGAGTVTIAGNLQVDGTTTTLNSTTLEIADKNLIIAKGGANDAAVDGAGITIDSATDITWNFVDADDAWVSSIGIKSTGPITGNLTGNVTGSVLTAAQTNITSVGTLTGLDVDATDEVTINTNKTSGYIAKFNQDNASNSAQIEIGSPTDNNTRPVSIDIKNAGTLKWSVGQAYSSTAVGAFHIATSALQTNDDGAKLTIRTDGNVGIGDDNPAALLSLKGSSPTVRFTNGTTLVGSIEGGANNIYYGFNNADIIFSTASDASYAPRLTINTAGSVRIDGSTSADHGLRFTPGGWNGYDNRIGYCGTSGADFWWSSNSNPTDGARDHATYATNYIQQNISTGYIAFGTGAVDVAASERLRIHNNGQLELKVPDANDALKITPSGTNATGAINFNTPGTGSASFKVQGSEGLRITKDLDVVIPAGYLQLDPTDHDKLKLKVPSGSSDDWNYLTFWGEDTTRNAYVGTNATGDLILSRDGGCNLIMGAAATFNGLVSDSKGDVRSVPASAGSGNYTLVASDAGKHVNISGSSATITVPANVFSPGDVITFIRSTGDATVGTIDVSAVTCYSSADGTTTNRTLAARGMATMICTSPNYFYISGAGMS